MYHGEVDPLSSYGLWATFYDYFDKMCMGPSRKYFIEQQIIEIGLQLTEISYNTIHGRASCL